MKLGINKQLKIGLISIIVSLIGLLSFILYGIVNNPNTEEQLLPVYKYSNIATIDYLVHLKPNPIYEEDTLESGQVYLSDFIEQIDIDFDYAFNGDSEIDLQGEYDIVARVTGFIKKGMDEEEKTVWEKSFPILSKQTFSTDEDSIYIKKSISLRLDDYNEFVKSVSEVTNISTDVNLQVSMNVEYKGNNPKGTFEENITPNIVIPLNTPMFEITTNNIEKPGAIEETIQVKLPINKNQIIFYGVIIGICALGLIFLIFFTVAAPEKDPLEKELNKIFKKHGDRLVALSTDVDFADAKYVRTIDDLVRLADEVERPILYKYSDNYKEISNFYVTNGDEIYVFDLEESTPREEDIISEQLTVNSEQ